MCELLMLLYIPGGHVLFSCLLVTAKGNEKTSQMVNVMHIANEQVRIKGGNGDSCPGIPAARGAPS